MEKSKTWFLQVGAWCLDPGPEHQSHLIRKTDCLYENNCGKMSKEGNPPGNGMVCLVTELGMESLKGVVVGNELGC